MDGGLRTIDRLFAEAVAGRGDAPAVVSPGRSISYRELDRRASQLARRLRALGIEREKVVAVMFDRSIELVIALFAVLKAGGAYVALDPSYPAERLIFMLEDTRAPVVIADERFTDRVPEHPSRVLIHVDEQSDPSEAAPLDSGNERCSLAALIYTSGSTGRPKAVEITHRGLVELLVGGDYLELDENDVVGHAANVSFDASAVEIFGALLNGARLVVIGADVVLEPELFARVLVEYRVNTLFLTTGLLNQFGRIIPGAFRTLKTLHFGGDAADPRSVRAILEQSRPKYLINAYGPTECTACAVGYWVTEVPEGATSIPIGKPIGGSEILLVDGEILIGGARIARGYYRRPELTKERFIPHPSRPGEVVYKTGDLARVLPNGDLDLIGRADSQVKIRGFRVELQEIEATLGRHPAVGETAVVALKDPAGEKYLVAYAAAAAADAAAAGGEISEKELKEYLAAKLPAHMIPRAIVLLERLPLTANGKVDRTALPAPVWVGSDDAGYEPPRTENERLFCRLYSEVLGVSRPGFATIFLRSVAIRSRRCSWSRACAPSSGESCLRARCSNIRRSRRWPRSWTKCPRRRPGWRRRSCAMPAARRS